MPFKSLRNLLAPDDGPEADGEIADVGKNSVGESRFSASLCHVDSPDAEARMQRALRLILGDGQRDETSAEPETKSSWCP